MQTSVSDAMNWSGYTAADAQATLSRLHQRLGLHRPFSSRTA